MNTALRIAANAAFAAGLGLVGALLLTRSLDRMDTHQQPGPWFVEPGAQLDDREVYFATRRAGRGGYETLRTPLGQAAAFDTVDDAHTAIDRQHAEVRR